MSAKRPRMGPHLKNISTEFQEKFYLSVFNCYELFWLGLLCTKKKKVSILTNVFDRKG